MWTCDFQPGCLAFSHVPLRPEGPRTRRCTGAHPAGRAETCDRRSVAMTGALGAALQELRRAARWHRRLLAAGLAAGAVALALSALSPAPPTLVRVVAATHDLRGGTTVSSRDIKTLRIPPGAVPAQTVRDPAGAVGRVLVSPVRSGEPLTDVRLLGPSLLGTLGAGWVAAPVRVADAAAVQLLHTGDLVDVVSAASSSGTTGATGSAGATAAVVAPAARVLLVPLPPEAGSSGDGALVVLAVDHRTALTLARAAMYARLSVLLQPP
jgi:pilus assembly protein CpaB